MKTLKEKIAVMQAADDGVPIKVDGYKVSDPLWNWIAFDYDTDKCILKTGASCFVRDSEEDKWVERHFFGIDENGVILTYIPNEIGTESWSFII